MSAIWFLCGALLLVAALRLVLLREFWTAFTCAWIGVGFFVLASPRRTSTGGRE